MSYEKYFTRYGGPSDDGEVLIRGHLLHPAKLTPDRIARNDETAARIIADCEKAIEAMTEYRQALAARYAALATAPYSLRLELERYPSNGKGVRYSVRIVKTYEDGTAILELHEQYMGKDRRQALARFEELKKQRPGIEVKKDIECRSWER